MNENIARIKVKYTPAIICTCGHSLDIIFSVEDSGKVVGQEFKCKSCGFSHYQVLQKEIEKCECCENESCLIRHDCKPVLHLCYECNTVIDYYNKVRIDIDDQ